VHGRPASARHKGKSNLNAIKSAVEACSIPIIANGGIIDALTALDAFENTGCAGIMIGQGAIGDFGIFNRIINSFETASIAHRATWEERLDSLTKHAKASIKFYGENLGIVRLRKLVPYYLKGLPNASQIRNNFCKIDTESQMNDLLKTIWDSPYM
jgi:tRNA-dihydrouridine synthase B